MQKNEITLHISCIFPLPFLKHNICYIYNNFCYIQLKLFQSYRAVINNKNFQEPPFPNTQPIFLE